MPEKNVMTENNVRKLVQEEIKMCFEVLQTDVKDIKDALLGNDYKKGGLVVMVNAHEEYIERNRITGVAERGMVVIEWFEKLQKKKGTDGRSELQVLEDGIQGLETIKTLKVWLMALGVTNVGTIIALIVDWVIRGLK